MSGCERQTLASSRLAPATRGPAAAAALRPIWDSRRLLCRGWLLRPPSRPAGTQELWHRFAPPDRKDIAKPEAYDSNTDHWLNWSKNFEKLLRRHDEKWPKLLEDLEKFKGRPVTEADEA